jgi:hypothetical protein
MSDADELRRLATIGADAIDNTARYEATIAGLEAARDTAAAEALELRRQLQEQPMPGPATLDNLDGAQRIDTFPGKDANTKLDAALSYVGAIRGKTTITPPLIAPTSRFDTSGTRVIPDGLVISYPWAPNTDFQRGAESAHVDWRHTSGPDKPMFVLDHDTFGVALERFTVMSTAAGVFFDTRGHTLWTSTIRDLGATGFKHVLGTPTSKFLNTLITLEGVLNFNNASGQQVTWGGSDTRSFPARFAMDVGGAKSNKDAFAAANAYLFALSWQEKSDLDGFYITAEGAASAVLVDGRKSAGRLTLDKSIIEGRNDRQPCTRDLLRVRGGLVHADALSVNYAKKPTSVDRGAPIVVESGARLHLTRFSHSPAAGVGEDVPVVLVKAGGKLVIRDAEATGDAVGWKNPRIRVAVEKGGIVPPDDSVVIVPG